MDSTRHTCLKLEITETKQKETIFIKATWFQSHFDLSITNGSDSWICNASDSEVRDRADQWDQPVSEYIETAERYLGFQQPGSIYGFSDAGDGWKRLSWTFEKQGIKLEWRWKCKPSPNKKKTTAEILDFLMDANVRLSEEVVRKTQSFEKLKVEAEKCLSQSETFKNEKTEFESAVYAKFVAVLNSKKSKLRELRDRITKQETTGKSPQVEEEEEEDSGKTESYDEATDDDKSEEIATQDLGDPSETAPTTRKRRSRN